MKFGRAGKQHGGDSSGSNLPTPAEFANEFWDRENLNQPLWRPEIEHDPARHIPWLYPEYQTWQFGKSKITVFLRDGVEARGNSPIDPRNLESTVQDCRYISMFDLAALSLTHELYEAIRDRAERTAAAQRAEPDSVIAFEFRLREMLNEPELQVQHVLTGVTDGYADPVFGYTIPTK